MTSLDSKLLRGWKLELKDTQGTISKIAMVLSWILHPLNVYLILKKCLGCD